MIIYQIYPRSFGEEISPLGCSDLKGITAKLSYLSDLGVEAIWISPFVKSPMKDFGYDVSDYSEIDPLFGKMSDFDELLLKAKELKLRIIIDMVLSHSSDEHPWFKESSRNRSNEKSNWYVWADARPDGSPPNNWLSLFGGSAWQWNENRNQFYLHNFLKSQPDLNFHEPLVRKALLEACEFWLKKGVRGFRLDVCNFYFHNQSLKDNPPRDSTSKKTDGVHSGNPYNSQLHLYDKDQPENLDFLRELRSLADRYDAILMGEIVSDQSLKIMRDYIKNGGPLHTAYSFALFTEGFNGLELAEVLKDYKTNLIDGTPTWALGNHDTPRYISRWKANPNYPDSAKCFLSFLFALRGNIILFEGDELGLDEAVVPRELMQDPYGIEFYPEFKGRDGCRTPMPWKNSRPREKTWLPIPQSHLDRSVQNQKTDKGSVFHFTKNLISSRKKQFWLNTAPLEILFASREVIVIERQISKLESYIVAINGSLTEQKFEVRGNELYLAPFEVKDSLILNPPS